MKKLESPYTVNLLDMISDLEKVFVFLIMDFEEKGNLEADISNNPNISDSQIITMFIGVLLGLIFLKENKIIHGNIKPGNILLSSTNSLKLTHCGFNM